MIVKVLEDAEADLELGYEFYRQQQEGLGEYFLRSLAADIESLRFYAGIHPQSEDFYHFPAKRFPFTIYYSVAGEVVSVEAVIDGRRDPEWIQRRLRG